jgi:flagellar operon protein
MSQINQQLTSVDLDTRIAAQNQAVANAAGPQASAPETASPAQSSFAQTLRAASVGITLSAHAQTRLASRQIDLTESDYSKLKGAMDKAAAKGARSSLVLMDRSDNSQVGLVVSIPNRTVITAVDTQSLKENIFTNIDSAMMI